MCATAVDGWVIPGNFASSMICLGFDPQGWTPYATLRNGYLFQLAWEERIPVELHKGVVAIDALRPCSFTPRTENIGHVPLNTGSKWDIIVWTEV